MLSNKYCGILVILWMLGILIQIWTGAPELFENIGIHKLFNNIEQLNYSENIGTY